MTPNEQEAIDKSLASLSIEQRIAVKAQLMRAGLWQNAAESLPPQVDQEGK